ncbi:unnamed protein product [Effrenium voratum]|nr:unnamed protein product [Effrenium voratum]|eukprot:CAMPEP_0181430586 /NCGR_PEP_ID=MMETSP1110-20121109/17800_1 /TAXON_ID=174948 /ORGANISM="Symbiodinium sp., Strain CCMP421" /LENGTH=412 /DNA_ID=CAMNT_0023553907 /DNA_START=40 /DNA_END=1278 /DNA_ORIENTATION=+
MAICRADDKLQLKYHNSFIEVEDSDDGQDPNARSSSCPPLAARCSTVVEAEYQEAGCRSYVDSLCKNLVCPNSHLFNHANQVKGSPLGISPCSTISTASSNAFSDKEFRGSKESSKMQLKYHNSFINVEDSDEEPGQEKRERPSSCPPPTARCSTIVKAEYEEADRRSYVEELANKLVVGSEDEGMPAKIDMVSYKAMEGWFSDSPASASTTDAFDDTPMTVLSVMTPTSPTTPQTVASVMTDELFDRLPVQDVRRLGLPSCGSLGHPELCRRPCIYVATGECLNGDACSYCHMPHMEKVPKLDKRQRGIVQSLSRSELLALVLKFCRPKARRFGPAREILSLLKEEAGNAKLPSWVCERDVRGLHCTLQRMNFSNLIGLATHHAPSRAKHSPDSAQRLADALERLRENCLW